ncbi:MAG: hypothetical protein N2205_01025 [Candidatus Caldatribacterium sp.]|nr:hypothetical protein [Candidatus Caldatribacterium sp.]MCX7729785.1 hypothetical protein [Candidatus Caldatribacterium sp.]MDW8080380.1 hypothetical protein [Candidatus Calescibacterium sp.]
MRDFSLRRRRGWFFFLVAFFVLLGLFVFSFILGLSVSSGVL